MGARRPVLGRDGNSGLGEHQVGDHGPADAAGDLGREVGGGFPPAQATKGGVDERHDRVEVAPGNGAEHQDNREQPGRRGRRVLEQLEADGPGERCWAAIPEPMTAAAKNALPSNSARRRLQSGCSPSTCVSRR